ERPEGLWSAALGTGGPKHCCCLKVLLRGVIRHQATGGVIARRGPCGRTCWLMVRWRVRAEIARELRLPALAVCRWEARPSLCATPFPAQLDRRARVLRPKSTVKQRRGTRRSAARKSVGEAGSC